MTTALYRAAAALLGALFAALFVSQALAAWTAVQGKQNPSGGATSCAITLTSPVTSGDVVAGFFFYSSTTNVISTIVDDQSNSYIVVDVNGVNGFGVGSFWSNGKLTNGPQTITITANTSQGIFWCGVDEFTPAQSGAVALDGHTAAGGSAILTSGNFTTAQNGDLVYSAVVTSNGPGMTAGSGFTVLEGGGSAVASEFLSQTSASATTAGTWVGSGGNTTIVALAISALAPIMSGSGGTLPLLGVGSSSGGGSPPSSCSVGQLDFSQNGCNIMWMGG